MRMARLAAAFAALAALAGSAALASRARAARPWKAAVLAAVRPVDAVAAEALLEAAFPGAVVSARSQEAAFSSFSGIETVRLAELDSKLDEDDPRYDRYLSGLGSYFKTGSGTEEREIIYVIAGRGAEARARRTLEALPPDDSGGARWAVVASAESTPPWPALAGLAVVVALIIASGGARGAWAVAPLAAYLPAILLGGAAAAAAALASGYLLSILALMRLAFPYDPGRRWSDFLKALLTSRGGRTIAAAFTITLAASIAVPSALAATIASAIASALIADAIERRRAMTRQHGIFTPIPLLGRASGAWCSAGSRVAIASIGPIIACTAFLWGAGAGKDSLLSIPHPRRYTQEGAEDAPSLPSFEDYLEHMEFQQRFGTTRLPLGSAADASAYARVDLDPAGFAREGEEIRVHTTHSLPKRGIERALRAEGRGACVVLGPWPGRNAGTASGGAALGISSASLAALAAAVARAPFKRRRRAR